jgi:hypothetical protein
MSDDDATKKYHQIVVPDHSVKPSTSGTSFLRTGTFPSLTDKAKQPPGFRKSVGLARLAGDRHLKTGGSWHHVDGNRIETTTGRKVEVIAGSYVAHRGPGNSPGPNFAATWAMNSYTQIGSEDLPVGWEPTLDSQGNVEVDNQGQETGASAPSAATNDPSGWASSLSRHYRESYDPDPTTPGTPGTKPATETGDVPSISDGDVIATTWAQRVLTYIGSTNRTVPLVYQETRADTFHSWGYFGVESCTYVGTSDSPAPKVYAETHAGFWQQKTFAHSGDITTWNHAPDNSVWQDTLAVAMLTTNEAKVDISVFNTAPIFTTLNTCVQVVINLGAMGTLTIGPNVTINLPACLTFAGDNTGVKMASLDMNNAQTQIDAIRTGLRTVTNDVSTVTTYMHDEYGFLSNIRTELGGVYQNLGTFHNLGT